MGVAIGVRQAIERLRAGGLRAGDISGDALITIAMRLHAGVFVAIDGQHGVAICAGHPIQWDRAWGLRSQDVARSAFRMEPIGGLLSHIGGVSVQVAGCVRRSIPSFLPQPSESSTRAICAEKRPTPLFWAWPKTGSQSRRSCGAVATAAALS